MGFIDEIKAKAKTSKRQSFFQKQKTAELMKQQKLY